LTSEQQIQGQSSTTQLNENPHDSETRRKFEALAVRKRDVELVVCPLGTRETKTLKCMITGGSGSAKAPAKNQERAETKVVTKAVGLAEYISMVEDADAPHQREMEIEAGREIEAEERAKMQNED
jgi:hypothetical protein